MNSDFETVKLLLTAWGHAGETIVIYDPSRLTAEGRAEIEAIRGHVADRTIQTIGVDLAWLPLLFIFPSPDKLDLLERGFPVVIMGVEGKNADPRARGDRHDVELVKVAKNALEVETFRLTGRQSSVELARNTRARNLTAAAAEGRFAIPHRTSVRSRRSSTAVLVPSISARSRDPQPPPVASGGLSSGFSSRAWLVQTQWGRASQGPW